MLNYQNKAIIFDLGAVLLNLDFQKTLSGFEALTHRKLSKEIFFEVDFFLEFEKGNITSAEFRNGVRKWLQTEASDSQIDRAWNALLLDFPLERIALLKKLGKTNRIFLLSNTNEIHKAAFDQIYEETVRPFHPEAFDSLFEKAYYSHDLLDRKPNPSIYRKVLEMNALEASNTIFIDDNRENILGARSIGIESIHLEAPLTILDIFG